MACLQYSQHIDASERTLTGLRASSDSGYYGYYRGPVILNDYGSPLIQSGDYSPPPSTSSLRLGDLDIKSPALLEGFIDGLAAVRGGSGEGGVMTIPYGIGGGLDSSPSSSCSNSSGSGGVGLDGRGSVMGWSKGRGGGGKNGGPSNKEDKICGVCGDKALGFNFDAISCESCKAFFRRNAPKGPTYFVCPYDEKCKMDTSNRRFCKRCRLKKCFEIGMKREYILSEEEKVHKRQKIVEKKYLKKNSSALSPNVSVAAVVPATTTQNSPNATGSSMTPVTTSAIKTMPFDTGVRYTESIDTNACQRSRNSLQNHQPQQQQLQRQQQQRQQQQQQLQQQQHHQQQQQLTMHQLSCQPSPQQQHMQQQQYQQQMTYVMVSQAAEGSLSVEDSMAIVDLRLAYRNSLEVRIDREVSRNEADITDLVNIAELSVRRVIAMAKQIPAFKTLPQVEQIHLLKGGSIELLILRSVITFDTEKQHFLDPVDQEDTKAMKIEQLERAENGTGLFEDHMKFVRSLAHDLRADETTLILLLVISLFSPDRDNLEYKDYVSVEQDKYSQLLGKYLASIYPNEIARAIFPRLLMKLTDIRNLNEEHSQVLLKVNSAAIHPLMKEVLDLRC